MWQTKAPPSNYKLDLAEQQKYNGAELAAESNDVTLSGHWRKGQGCFMTHEYCTWRYSQPRTKKGKFCT
jgi:hypothetical protein